MFLRLKSFHALIAFVFVLIANSMALCGPPILVISGIDSKIERFDSVLIGNQEAFEKMYQRHSGLSQRDVRFGTTHLKIDFTKFTLVTLFHGADHNNRGINVTDVEEETDKVTIRYRPYWYNSIGKLNLTNSYAFILIPKTTKPVELVENISSGSGTPVWKKMVTVVPGK